MNVHVLLKPIPSSEAFVTFATLLRLVVVCGVRRQDVRHEALVHRKRLRTPVALVRPFARVRPHVNRQRIALGEAGVADAARVWLFARVRHDVLDVRLP